MKCTEMAVPEAAGALDLVNTASADALLADLDYRLAVGCGFAVATLNLDHVVKLRERPDFRMTYLQQSHVVADGRPIVWMRRLSGQPVELVTGSDLVAPLLALAARRDVPVAFFGSRQATLDTAAERLERRIPGLRIVARIAPRQGFDPSGPDAEAMLAELAASGARLCLVALGAPKQETFAVRALARMPACGFVSIGAGLDFIAGHQRRAPLWMRRLALEWFWRMMSDPRRLTRRYMLCFRELPRIALTALHARRTRRRRRLVTR